MSTTTTATAFAPASVGNVAVGFDILGMALAGAGDRVTVRRIDAPVVRVGKISGVTDDLPRAAEENTATVGLISLRRDLDLSWGFEVELDKGIALGSGMGGSAASAVGAIVAASALLDAPIPRERMLHYACLGESAASGGMHADNASPCLWGGLTLTRAVDPPDVTPLPAPTGVKCVLVHPRMRLDTRRARAAIPARLPLHDVIAQTANLAGLLAGCYRDDLSLIRRSLADRLIEPHRASLIPGFHQVQAAALEAGALGCSISGAGPSVFAWCEGDRAAQYTRDAMLHAFAQSGFDADDWISALDAPGARVIARS